MHGERFFNVRSVENGAPMTTISKLLLKLKAVALWDGWDATFSAMLWIGAMAFLFWKALA